MHTSLSHALPVPIPSPAAPVPTGPLTIEVARSLDVPPQDALALETLVEGRPEAGVFVSRAWLSGWFAGPPPDTEPELVLMRDGQTVRAVVPIGVRHVRSRVHVTLLGGGLGSDRVDLLAARGFDGMASDALLAWLNKRFGQHAFVLELRDVAAESPLWGAISRLNATGTTPVVLHPREVHTHPYLDLTDASYRLDGRAWPNGDVQSFNRHFRRLERHGRVEMTILRDPDDVMSAFDSLTAFLHARWAQDASGSALDHPPLQRFHRRVLPHLLKEGRLRMLRLSVNHRTVAVAYGLANAAWRGYYLAGYDRAWAGRIHLGRVLAAVAIDRAVQEGAVEFDFLKGAEPVKYDWPVRQRATLDADVYSARTGAQLARAAHATREALSALVKSGRGLLAQGRAGARQPM